jgi:hypothetical protein
MGTSLLHTGALFSLYLLFAWGLTVHFPNCIHVFLLGDWQRGCCGWDFIEFINQLGENRHLDMFPSFQKHEFNGSFLGCVFATFCFCMCVFVRKVISIKVFVTLLDYLKIPQVAILGDLHILRVLAASSGFLYNSIVHQTACPNPSPKLFSHLGKTVTL